MRHARRGRNANGGRLGGCLAGSILRGLALFTHRIERTLRRVRPRTAQAIAADAIRATVRSTTEVNSSMTASSGRSASAPGRSSRETVRRSRATRNGLSQLGGLESPRSTRAPRPSLIPKLAGKASTIDLSAASRTVDHGLAKQLARQRALAATRWATISRSASRALPAATGHATAAPRFDPPVECRTSLPVASTRGVRTTATDFEQVTSGIRRSLNMAVGCRTTQKCQCGMDCTTRSPMNYAESVSQHSHG